MLNILVYAGGAIVLLIGILLMVSGNKQQGRHDTSQSDKFFLSIYNKINKFPLTNGMTRKLYNKLQAMSVYTKRDICINTAKNFTIKAAMTFAVIIAGIFMFRDVISIILCAGFAITSSTILVDKKIDKINFKVYTELRATVSSIRQEYMRLDSVPEALVCAEYGKLLRKNFDEIGDILTSANGDLKLKEFFERVPFRPIQTIARICYDINNVGDEVDKYGQSNFVQALTIMSTDINAELERMIYQRKTFGYIEYLTFVPLIGIHLLDSYFSGVIPGTALVYNGMIGYIFHAVTLFACIACYNIIAKINTMTGISDDDRNLLVIWIERNVPGMVKFSRNLSAKNAQRRRLIARMDKALSKKSVEQLYIEKTLDMLVAFIISMIAAVTFTQMAKDFVLNTTAQLSLVATDEMDEYEKQEILALDKKYIAQRMDGYEFETEELYALIYNVMPNLTDLQVQDQATRLEKKYNQYINTYFKWWYVLICGGIGWFFWFIPNIMLIFRAYLVKTEAEEDFLQMQTLMTIIMNTDSDTLDALEQLYQVSKIHKDILIYCYHGYPSNPEKELSRLESKTPIIEFKRFCGKLKLTIDDLSLKDAFSDLSIEREYIMQVRDMTIRTSINRKRGIAGKLSTLPVWLMIIGDLLFPIGYLAINEFTTAVDSMQSL